MSLMPMKEIVFKKLFQDQNIILSELIPYSTKICEHPVVNKSVNWTTVKERDYKKNCEFVF